MQITRALFTLVSIEIIVLNTVIAADNVCTTPKGKIGSCIVLQECQSLFDLIRSPTLTSDDQKFLTSSQCGYKNNKVFVCCVNRTNISPTPRFNPWLANVQDSQSGQTTEKPSNPWLTKVEPTKVTSYGNCNTPRQEPGTCVALTDCTALYNIIQKPPISNSDRTFLANSQCGYTNNNVLVCCSNRNLNVAVDNSNSNTNSNLLPQPPTCGVQLSDRIVGGKITQLLEFPWLALVEYTKPGNVKGHHCGGTLISERYVVTAAHCVAGPAIPSDWRLSGVRLGEWDTTMNPDFEDDIRGRRTTADAHVDVAVERSIMHPQYGRTSRNQLNDIALLRMAQKVPFTSYVKPICLPTQEGFGGGPDFVNARMDVVGWGSTENGKASTVKLKALVDVWNLDDCRSTYRAKGFSLETTQMCAGGQSGVDSCRGDSGGPLMTEDRVNNRNYYFLAGIVSYGPTPCGLPGWPGVYTRVAAYVNWIKSTMQP